MKSKSIPILFLSCCFLSLIVSCQHFRFVRPLKNKRQYVKCLYGTGCLPDLPPSKSYQKYMNFRDNMSLEKLYEYANHKDEVIKTYAYWALLEREELKKIEPLFVKMLQDTSKIDHRCAAVEQNSPRIKKAYTAYHNYCLLHPNHLYYLETDTTIFVEFYGEDANFMRSQAIKLQKLDSLIILNEEDEDILRTALGDKTYYAPVMVKRIVELAMRTHSDGLKEGDGKAALGYLSYYIKLPVYFQYHKQLLAFDTNRLPSWNQDIFKKLQQRIRELQEKK